MFIWSLWGHKNSLITKFRKAINLSRFAMPLLAVAIKIQIPGHKSSCNCLSLRAEACMQIAVFELTIPVSPVICDVPNWESLFEYQSMALLLSFIIDAMAAHQVKSFRYHSSCDSHLFFEWYVTLLRVISKLWASFHNGTCWLTNLEKVNDNLCKILFFLTWKSYFFGLLNLFESSPAFFSL